VSFMNPPFSRRRRSLLKELDKAGLSALVSTHPPNWYYLTGFTGEAGVLVASQNGATLVTDGRFITQAKDETSSVQIVKQKRSLFESAGELLRTKYRGRIGFDPNQLSVAQLRLLKKTSGARCHWVAAPGMVELVRSRKEQEEISHMRRAAVLAGEVVNSTLRLLKPGVRENEIAAEAEYQMRKRGASGPAFETIVAFGERSALPHARPTLRPLGKNELVVLDLGVILAHYCSDITRTVYVGRAPKRVRDWYKAVQEAQVAAICKARVGATCGDVDAAARKVLASYKLEQKFTHSTGHGLGLEVHEDPRVAKGQTRILETGNVITIEPGVYVEGVGGIRIEDDVALHNGRTEVLTRIPRDLIEL
jgi:Xaa-Pro aminopeptidase